MKTTKKTHPLRHPNAKEGESNSVKSNSLPLPCGGGLRGWVDSYESSKSTHESSVKSTQDSPQKLTQEKIIKDGFDFSFNPAKCAECGGKCCIGESGYIFLSKIEMGKIAEFLGLNFGDFTRRFIRQVGAKYSLIEKPYENGFACIFFDESNRQCQIYPVRPAQCKEFPFWDIFKNNIEGAKRECEGVESHKLTRPSVK